MTTEDDTKEKMNSGEHAFRCEYRAEITSLAEGVKARAQAGEFTDSCDVYQAVEEAIDGHQYVIYTNYNYWVLMTSDNDDAMIEEGVEIDPKVGWFQTLAQMAYFAMKADVMEELGDVEVMMSDLEDQASDDAHLEGEEASQ